MASRFANSDNGILTDRMIAEMTQAGHILPSAPFADDQVQPASLDLRLGPIAYRVRASFLPGPGATVAQRIKDLQFAPMVVAKKETDEMVHLLATTAKAQNVDLFRRFAVMRHWRHVARLPFEAFISPDDLHMNDWSYACVAKLLGGAIAEAATRTTLAASAGQR